MPGLIFERRYCVYVRFSVDEFNMIGLISERNGVSKPEFIRRITKQALVDEGLL